MHNRSVFFFFLFFDLLQCGPLRSRAINHTEVHSRAASFFLSSSFFSDILLYSFYFFCSNAGNYCIDAPHPFDSRQCAHHVVKIHHKAMDIQAYMVYRYDVVTKRYWEINYPIGQTMMTDIVPLCSYNKRRLPFILLYSFSYFSIWTRF